MPNRFVLDCSVAMSWCFEDEKTEYTELVLDSLKTNIAIASSLWNLEISNVLVMASKRNRISENDTYWFLSLLNDLPIYIEEPQISINDLVSLAKKHDLTAYDGCYLSLCMLKGLPLATLDKKLADVVKGIGGKLYKR